jgi:glyoxylase-like metal-dependent hydrolase (beta-lactamase superfamily II)
MARMLFASIAAMVLATIASPGWSQAPAQPTAPSAQPGASAAQPSRPQIETRKVEGTENVYIFRNGNHQAMFIVTPEGVIATDPVAYGRPTGGQQYIDEIKKVTQAPIRYLIYSHHHFDHIAGGKAFKDAGATIVAHKRAKERLEVLKDPHTPLPDETVDIDRTITLGGTTLELSYVGAKVMRLPREKIIFIVDLLPVGTVPGRGMIDFYPLEAEESIKKVLGMDWDRLIPGHPGSGGRLGTKQDAQDQLTLLQEASAEMKKLGQEGKCWDAAEKEFKLPKYRPGPAMTRACPSSRAAIAHFGAGVPKIVHPCGSPLRLRFSDRSHFSARPRGTDRHTVQESRQAARSDGDLAIPSRRDLTCL